MQTPTDIVPLQHEHITELQANNKTTHNKNSVEVWQEESMQTQNDDLVA